MHADPASDAQASGGSASGDAAIGLISTVRDRAGIGHLGAFWVDPRARGTGLGAQLFDTAMHWLTHIQCGSLELSVTEGNAAAEAMYARRGFARDGRTEPLREGSTLRNIYMVKNISLVFSFLRGTCDA